MKRIAILIMASSLAIRSYAEPLSFDFKDPKGVNNVVFKLDAPLESINGTATGISGEVSYDPEKPESIKGKISVTAVSLKLPNDKMLEHLQSPMWMNAAKYPNITFEALSADNVKTADGKTTADVTGNMTIKDVTKKITLPVKITYLKGRLKERLPSMDGDLLVLRSTFSVKRSDYGVNKGAYEDKVSDDIELTLSLAGMCPVKK